MGFVERLKKRLQGQDSEDDSPYYVSPLSEKTDRQETAENMEYMQSRGKSNTVKKFNAAANAAGTEGIRGYISEPLYKESLGQQPKRKITSRRINLGR